MSARPGEVGSAAEEAARLFAAAEHWARERAGGLRDGVGGGLGPEHLANGSAACTVCPFCQAVAALRQVRPETVEHLLDAAASVVAALRTTLTGDATPAPGTRATVQHIHVEEDSC